MDFWKWGWCWLLQGKTVLEINSFPVHVAPWQRQLLIRFTVNRWYSHDRTEEALNYINVISCIVLFENPIDLLFIIAFPQMRRIWILLTSTSQCDHGQWSLSLIIYELNEHLQRELPYWAESAPVQGRHWPLSRVRGFLFAFSPLLAINSIIDILFSKLIVMA